jgi:hypothetical protein
MAGTVLGRQFCPAALAPPLQHLASALGCHAGAKPVTAFTNQPARLKCTFHLTSPPLKVPEMLLLSVVQPMSGATSKKLPGTNGIHLIDNRSAYTDYRAGSQRNNPPKKKAEKSMISSVSNPGLHQF